MDKIVEDLVLKNRGATPLLFGISGCQGSGKTTLTTKAAQDLNKKGIPTIAVSIDDFYLPHSDQLALASKGNPLLRQRGLFPSHDVQLMLKVLHDLKSGHPTMIPVYDKAQFNGQGDRVGERKIDSKYEAILVEGWCLGFKPIGSVQIKKSLEDPACQATRQHTLEHLCEIDTALQDYQRIWQTLDNLVYLRPAELDFVYAWRLQQEQELRKIHGTGMTDSEVRKFVDQYMPAYELYKDTVSYDLQFSLAFDRTFTLID